MKIASYDKYLRKIAKMLKVDLPMEEEFIEIATLRDQKNKKVKVDEEKLAKLEKNAEKGEGGGEERSER